jgi:glyoxylate/hydroxypyruvate reductase
VPFGIRRCIFSTNPARPRTDSDTESERAFLASLASRLSPSSPSALQLQRVPLPTLASESDLLFVLAPGGPSTHHIIDESFLRQMKPTAVLVNPSRGTLVDSDALARALREGWIWGAGVDVVEGEPEVGGGHCLVREPR